MKIAPCVSCESNGCGAYHDICPEFLEWRDEIKAAKMAINKQKEIDNLCRTKPVKRRKLARV